MMKLSHLDAQDHTRSLDLCDFFQLLELLWGVILCVYIYFLPHMYNPVKDLNSQ